MSLEITFKKAENSLSDLANALFKGAAELERLKKERQQYEAEMKVCDIAKFLDCTSRTVHNMLADGRLKSKKMMDVLELKKQT